MSGPTHQRSLWQVLALYLAGSWLCLQIVDVFSQNMGLPTWVFTMTLVLLGVGLPVTAATAYYQGIGRQTRGSPAAAGGPLESAGTAAGSAPSGAKASGTRRLFTWRNVLRAGVAALAVWGVAVTAWLLVARDNGSSQWDLVSGLDEMRRLVGEYDYAGANTIARELDGLITNDSVREAMWNGGERLTAFLFLPVGGKASPPFQTVAYFPGSNDIYKESYDEIDIGSLDFILRSGRAVLYPICKGTFERGTELRSDVQDESSLYRDTSLPGRAIPGARSTTSKRDPTSTRAGWPIRGSAGAARWRPS